MCSTVLLLASSGLAEGAPPPPATAAAAQPGGPVVELRIAGRKPVGGVRTVRGVRGQKILLKMISDEKLSVHVHGLEHRLELAAGVPATLSVDARQTGRFPVTAHLDSSGGRHGHEPTLLYLEVHPD